MKNIVLDGDRIAEAIQKAKDKMINGEYDNNDLILRGDALKAIRQRCISEHLPFKSNTLVGARVLDALAAVYHVKPYKDVCGKWISVKDRLPTNHVKVIVAVKTIFGYAICMGSLDDDGSWEESTFCETYGEMRFEEKEPVVAWMPLPEPPEVTP